MKYPFASTLHNHTPSATGAMKKEYSVNSRIARLTATTHRVIGILWAMYVRVSSLIDQRGEIIGEAG